MSRAMMAVYICHKPGATLGAQFRYAKLITTCVHADMITYLTVCLLVLKALYSQMQALPVSSAPFAQPASFS